MGWACAPRLSLGLTRCALRVTMPVGEAGPAFARLGGVGVCDFGAGAAEKEAVWVAQWGPRINRS